MNTDDTTFDPSVFEETAIDEAMETRYRPVEEGEFEAIIEKHEVRKVNTKQGVGIVLDIFWNIIDEDLKARMEMENVQVKQSIFLDTYMDGDIVRLATGPNKNIKLGRLREELSQNKSGKAWTFGQLDGAGPVIVQVTQRADPKDSTVIYNDIGRIRKAA